MEQNTYSKIQEEEKKKKKLVNVQQAEQMYLGLLMDDAQHVLENSRTLLKECFSSPIHEMLFTTCKTVYQIHNSAEVFLVIDYLEQKNEMIETEKFSLRKYLFELMQVATGKANIKVYADYIWQAYTERKLVDAANNIISTAGNVDMSLKDKITSSNLLLSEIESLEEERKIKSIRDVLKDSLEVLANNMSGNNAFTPTQFEDLDAIILGLDQPSYVVIGGRPGMGKTSLGMQIIENMAKQGKKSLVFSLEMPQEQLLLRMISSNARVPFTNLRKGKLTETDIAKIQLTVEKLKELPISFDDDGSNTIADIEKKAKAMKDKQGLDVVLIDYIQLLKGDNPKLFGKRNSEMEDISRRLMSMGKRLNMTVIILAQLNRNVEERIDKRPVMSDLRDTGGIEQDANLIMFCYRDEYYNKENTDKLGQAEVIIRKARNGAVGTATLRFIGEYTRFEQWIPEEDDIDYDDNPF